jgi:hypothetical protein
MDKFKSRKFWFALFGSLLPIIASYLTAELSLEAALTASSAVLCTYIIGQGYVDGKSAE